MKARSVKIGPRANADIRRIGEHIANLGAPVTATRVVGRLADFVQLLNLASQRGIDRNDIRQGLRIIPFERIANLAVLVSDDTIIIVRVFYHGQDWEGPLRRQFEGKN